MKRWGIAKKSEDQGLDDGEDMVGQPYAVVIRPAIADVLGEAALARLVQFKAVASANDEPEAVTSVAEEGESQE
ncbi:hypothetical protein D3C78_1905810 [compost metagenome]